MSVGNLFIRAYADGIHPWLVTPESFMHTEATT